MLAEMAGVGSVPIVPAAVVGVATLERSREDQRDRHEANYET